MSEKKKTTSLVVKKTTTTNNKKVKKSKKTKKANNKNLPKVQKVVTKKSKPKKVIKQHLKEVKKVEKQVEKQAILAQKNAKKVNKQALLDERQHLIDYYNELKARRDELIALKKSGQVDLNDVDYICKSLEFTQGNYKIRTKKSTTNQTNFATPAFGPKPTSFGPNAPFDQQKTTITINQLDSQKAFLNTFGTQKEHVNFSTQPQSLPKPAKQTKIIINSVTEETNLKPLSEPKKEVIIDEPQPTIIPSNNELKVINITEQKHTIVKPTRTMVNEEVLNSSNDIKPVSTSTIVINKTKTKHDQINDLILQEPTSINLDNESEHLNIVPTKIIKREKEIHPNTVVLRELPKDAVNNPLITSSLDLSQIDDLPATNDQRVIGQIQPIRDSLVQPNFQQISDEGVTPDIILQCDDVLVNQKGQYPYNIQDVIYELLPKPNKWITISIVVVIVILSITIFFIILWGFASNWSFVYDNFAIDFKNFFKIK